MCRKLSYTWELMGASWRVLKQDKEPSKTSRFLGLPNLIEQLGMQVGLMTPRKKATMTTKGTHSARNAARHRTRTDPIDENSCGGLALLRHSYACAQNAGADLWDFALEIDTLYEAGLTISDLRWLVANRSPITARNRPFMVIRIAPSDRAPATSSSRQPVWSSHQAVPNSPTIS